MQNCSAVCKKCRGEIMRGKNAEIAERFQLSLELCENQVSVGVPSAFCQHCNPDPQACPPRVKTICPQAHQRDLPFKHALDSTLSHDKLIPISVKECLTCRRAQARTRLLYEYVQYRFRSDEATGVMVHNVAFNLRQSNGISFVPVTASFAGAVKLVEFPVKAKEDDDESVEAKITVMLHPRTDLHFVYDVQPLSKAEATRTECPVMFPDEFKKYCVTVCERVRLVSRNSEKITRTGNLVLGKCCKPHRCRKTCRLHDLGKIQTLDLGEK